MGRCSENHSCVLEIVFIPGRGGSRGRIRVVILTHFIRIYESFYQSSCRFRFVVCGLRVKYVPCCLKLHPVMKDRERERERKREREKREKDRQTDK